MDFEQTKNELIKLSQQWAQANSNDMYIIEDIEIEASVALLKYCITNNEKIDGVDLHKLLELDDEAEDYEDNFNKRHEFISQVYYKDEQTYTDENISKNVQQLAAYFYDLLQ